MTVADTLGDRLLVKRNLEQTQERGFTVARIGVVLFVNHETSQEYILDQADATMYQAKYAGRNRVQFYEEEARPSSSLRTK